MVMATQAPRDTAQAARPDAVALLNEHTDLCFRAGEAPEGSQDRENWLEKARVTAKALRDALCQPRPDTAMTSLEAVESAIAETTDYEVAVPLHEYLLIGYDGFDVDRHAFADRFVAAIACNASAAFEAMLLAPQRADAVALATPVAWRARDKKWAPWNLYELEADARIWRFVEPLYAAVLNTPSPNETDSDSVEHL